MLYADAEPLYDNDDENFLINVMALNLDMFLHALR